MIVVLFIINESANFWDISSKTYQYNLAYLFHYRGQKDYLQINIKQNQIILS